MYFGARRDRPGRTRHGDFFDHTDRNPSRMIVWQKPRKLAKGRCGFCPFQRADFAGLFPQHEWSPGDHPPAGSPLRVLSDRHTENSLTQLAQKLACVDPAARSDAVKRRVVSCTKPTDAGSPQFAVWGSSSKELSCGQAIFGCRAGKEAKGSVSFGKSMVPLARARDRSSSTGNGSFAPLRRRLRRIRRRDPVRIPAVGTMIRESAGCRSRATEIARQRNSASEPTTLTQTDAGHQPATAYGPFIGFTVKTTSSGTIRSVTIDPGRRGGSRIGVIAAVLRVRLQSIGICGEPRGTCRLGRCSARHRFEATSATHPPRSSVARRRRAQRAPGQPSSGHRRTQPGARKSIGLCLHKPIWKSPHPFPTRRQRSQSLR